MYLPNWSDVSPYQSQFVLGKGITVVNGENSEYGNYQYLLVSILISNCKQDTVFIALFVVQSIAVLIYLYLHIYEGGGSSKESQDQESAAQTCNNPSSSPVHEL